VHKGGSGVVVGDRMEDEEEEEEGEAGGAGGVTSSEDVP